MKYILIPFLVVLFWSQVSAQCSNLQLVVDKSEFCLPGIVKFQVLNAMPGATYQWMINNDTIYGADTLYHFFSTSGKKNASARITLPDSSYCVLQETEIVTVFAPPNPQFLASKTLLCDDADSVTLTDITPNCKTRNWVVDGSNYSNTSPSIVHSFVSPGHKNVSLIISDSNGCQGVAEFKDTIKIYRNPAIDFTADVTKGCTPLEVNFSQNNQYGVSPFTEDFLWTFNDDIIDTSLREKPLARTYTSSGRYDVKLDVTVSNGCSYSVIKRNYIQLGDSTSVHLNASADTSCANQEITLYPQTQEFSGELKWLFSGVAHTVLHKSKDSAVVKCAENGNLNVSLHRTENGCTSIGNYQNIVHVKSIKASFEAFDRHSCVVPHTVSFSNSLDTLSTSILSYSWRLLMDTVTAFTSASSNPSFTFNDFLKCYDVELAVQGENGCSDTLRKNNYITLDSFKVKVVMSQEKTCAGEEIKPATIVSSSCSDVPFTPSGFKWYFSKEQDTSVLDSSFSSQPTITYSDTGSYSIKLISENIQGCSDTFVMSKAITIVAPEVRYDFLDTTSWCSGDNITLVGSSTPADMKFDYQWTLVNMDDSTTSYQARGSHTYINPKKGGRYKGFITHSFARGCRSTDSFYMEVNEVLASLSFDSSNGCTPFFAKPQTSILSSRSVGFADSSHTYTWTISPDNGVTTENEFSSSPTFIFSEDMDFSVVCQVRNAAGCFSSPLSNKISVGARAKIELPKTNLCSGDSIDVYDKSAEGSTAVSWKISPSVPHRFVSKSEKIDALIIDAVGDFVLEQFVSRNDVCFDTARTSFSIADVKANFSVVDSFLSCAPVYAEFESNSKQADTLIWFFGIGDTIKTIQDRAGFIYQKNSGWNKGYDITLIAKNEAGCADTVVRKDYLVVSGPVPKIEVSSNEGCEPLLVEFANKSTDAVAFFLNFNDGTPLDSSSQKSTNATHLYTVRGANAKRQAVMPGIIVFDSLGCVAYAEAQDSVVIYRKPVAQVEYPNGVEGCSPFTWRFNDTGSYSSEYSWRFNDIEISTTQMDSFTESKVGIHNLSVISSNDNFCADTVNTSVEVFQVPQVSFSFSDTVCFAKPIAFFSAVGGETLLDSLSWTFGGDGEEEDCHSKNSNPVFSFMYAGSKQVKLYAKAINGCADSSTASLTITDESAIDNPQINYVSFENNYEVHACYEMSTTPNFRRYRMETSLQNTEIYAREQTVLIEDFGVVGPTDTPYYTLYVGDYCDLEGKASTTHRPILLGVKSTKAYENELNWSPYSGWSLVKAYEIFRRNSNGVYVKLAEVDGNTTSYVDFGLCNEEYFYYVQALHPKESFISKSCMVSSRPLYAYNPSLSSIKVVSVEQENEISVKWNASRFSEFQKFKITKYESSRANKVETLYTRDTFLLDDDVLSNEFSYIYEVQELDRCGYENSVQREGKSILLTGTYTDKSNLSWTPYQNWQDGVNEYTIDVDVAGSFQPVEKVPGKLTQYSDRKYYSNILGEYCYRVVASNNVADTSYSNVVCVSGDPKVYIPTAFTPNGDGLNDDFHPVSRFILFGKIGKIESYLFEVYTRWGEKIVETTDVNYAWDGRYSGENCQAGAYVFKLRIMGVNGKWIHKSGTVTLVR